jgi:hypothetical protein
MYPNRAGGASLRLKLIETWANFVRLYWRTFARHSMIQRRTKWFEMANSTVSVGEATLGMLRVDGDGCGGVLLKV